MQKVPRTFRVMHGAHIDNENCKDGGVENRLGANAGKSGSGRLGISQVGLGPEQLVQSECRSLYCTMRLQAGAGGC